MLRDLPSTFGSPDVEDNLMNIPDMAHVDFPSQMADNSLDDVFGSTPTSPDLSARGSADVVAATARLSINDPSDVPRLRNTHVTNGYREGIAASKEQHLQQGFDQGYALGADIGLMAGWCLGALDAIANAFPDAGIIIIITTSSQLSRSRLPSVGSSMSKSEVERLIQLANAELDILQLFGPDYFSSDGLPLYEVCPQMAESVNGDRDPRRRRDTHPLIRLWTDVVEQLASQLHLDISLESDCAAATNSDRSEERHLQSSG